MILTNQKWPLNIEMQMIINLLSSHIMTESSKTSLFALNKKNNSKVISEKINIMKSISIIGFKQRKSNTV